MVEFMQKILDNNHAEIAPPLQNNEECWYLPLFGVYHPKKPDQIRGISPVEQLVPCCLVKIVEVNETVGELPSFLSSLS
jgi:hypothetical protein